MARKKVSCPEETVPLEHDDKPGAMPVIPDTTLFF